MSWFNRSRESNYSLSRQRRRPNSRRIEALERREVLSADLEAAFSIGSDDGVSGVTGVAADAAGNSFVTGIFSGVVDFDATAVHSGNADILTSRGGTDAFVAKYGPDDSLLWLRRMGGDQPGSVDSGRNFALDPSGSVFVSGNFSHSGDFGATTLVTAGDTDGFIVQIDAQGGIQWAKRFGNSGNDFAHGVGAHAAGNAYAMTARYADSLDVVKYRPNGSVAWTKSIRTRSASADLAVDAAGNSYIVGSFDGTVDFDPGRKTEYVSAGSNASAFTLKLDTSGNFRWVSPFRGRTVDSVVGYSAAQSVALDSQGNVLVGGYYDNVVDFNPSATDALPSAGAPLSLS